MVKRFTMKNKTQQQAIHWRRHAQDNSRQSSQYPLQRVAKRTYRGIYWSILAVFLPALGAQAQAVEGLTVNVSTGVAASTNTAKANEKRMDFAFQDIPVRALLRQKGTPYDELGLQEHTLSDEHLLNAMLAHPILINRPIVVSPKGVRLCRPSEEVLDLLPPQRGEFVKEDGECVIDEHGQRVATA